MASVVLGNIKASELPAAWRKRAKVKGDELPAVTIARRQRQTATKPPNASFGMWAECTDLDPAAYVRTLRHPRTARR
jgi:hypothetical protein